MRAWTAHDVGGLVVLAERAGVEGSLRVLGAQLEHERLSRLQPDHYFCRLVAEVDGRIVGTAFAQDQIFIPRGWLSVRVHVDSEHRRRGIGSALASALEARLEVRRSRGLMARIRAGDTQSRSWAERRRFAFGLEEATCILDPWTVPDAGPDATEIDTEGVSLFSFAEDGRSAAPRLYELVSTLLGHTPQMGDAPGPSSRDVECAFEHGLRRAPEATWVASRGEEWIGVTISGRNGEDTLYTWLTGVTPEWRGKGIARALKMRAIRAAKFGGVRCMVSEVALSNEAMLNLNRSMGATLQQPVWVMRRTGWQPDKSGAPR